MVIVPQCQGPCEISLRYTGGPEHAVTRGLSVAALLLAMVYGWRGRPLKAAWSQDWLRHAHT